MNLFIDTNVFLNFFHLSGEDIEELRKLVELIEEKELTLWLPSQVQDEFRRNRDKKISESMNSATKSLKLAIPAFYRHKKEFKKISDDLKKINKKMSSLTDEITNEIDNEKLDADILIKKIFKKAKLVNIDSGILDAAVDRAKRGNPPGKGNGGSVGDEINWETLLGSVPDNTDMHIVSADGDYASVRDNSRPHAFLEKEWNEEIKGDLFLYKGLSEFFAEHFKNIKLASDIAKDKALARLAASGSFASTHNAISKLMPLMGTFTEDDAKIMIESAENNEQVHWILDDEDVHEFYLGIQKTVKLNDDLQERLDLLIKGGDHDD